MINWLLFENRVALAVGWGLLIFVLAVCWARLRTKASGRFVLVAVLMAPMLLAVSTFVVTPREQIQALCRSLAQHVEANRPDALAGFLADDFQSDELDRDRLIQLLSSSLTRYQVRHSRVDADDVTIEPDGSWTVEVAASCEVSGGSEFAGRLPTRWRLTLRHGADGLRIVEAKPIPVAPLHLRTIHQLLR